MHVLVVGDFQETVCIIIIVVGKGMKGRFVEHTYPSISNGMVGISIVLWEVIYVWPKA